MCTAFTWAMLKDVHAKHNGYALFAHCSMLKCSKFANYANDESVGMLFKALSLYMEHNEFRWIFTLRTKFFLIYFTYLHFAC